MGSNGWGAKFGTDGMAVFRLPVGIKQIRTARVPKFKTGNKVVFRYHSGEAVAGMVGHVKRSWTPLDGALMIRYDVASGGRVIFGVVEHNLEHYEGAWDQETI